MIRRELWRGGHYFYVIFDKRRGDKSRWWHYFLNKDYNHCFVIAAASPTQTLMIDPLHWGIYLNVFDATLEQTIEYFRGQEVTDIVCYRTSVNPRQYWRPRGFYSCVSVVKSILNHRCFSITPKGFFKRLIKAGGKRVGLDNESSQGNWQRLKESS